jgi:hypothetical protein
MTVAFAGEQFRLNFAKGIQGGMVREPPLGIVSISANADYILISKDGAA